MNLQKYNPMPEKKKDNSEKEIIISQPSNILPDITGQAAATPQINSDHKGTTDHPAWMSSPRVILLIEYLKKHEAQAIMLTEYAGRPGLRFNPGLNAFDLKNERGRIASNAFDLLMDAAEDLKAMIKDKIEIPLLRSIKRSHRSEDSTPRSQGPNPKNNLSELYSKKFLNEKKIISETSENNFAGPVTHPLSYGTQ